MSPEEQAFFQHFGTRLAAARKALSLSQQALADQLGIAQQALAHYEVGRARPPVSLGVQMARTRGLGVEELLGEPVRAVGKRGPAHKLQQQMERIAQLPRAKPQLVIHALDGVLGSASR